MPRPDPQEPAGPAEPLAVLGFLLLVTLLALRPLPLPEPAAAGAAAAEFSAGRALGHLERIARRPHPVGSEEHDRVRDELLGQLTALGFQTRVQEATATRVFQVGTVRTAWAGRMQNVLGRRKGSDSTGALLLVSHYDSAPSSPGASDSGAAVAAILEIVRALAASGPLRNDLIVLFTDGEETGCLGAQAFADSDPWAADVSTVLNFDARGTRGPVLMFETGPDNGWLLGQLAGTPYPVASSLAATVYPWGRGPVALLRFSGRRLRAGAHGRRPKSSGAQPGRILPCAPPAPVPAAAAGPDPEDRDVLRGDAGPEEL